MLRLGNFHEEDYDGVVLKLPRWFIEMNKLEQPLADFKKALEESKFSMYFSDHVNNLHELNNSQDKIQIVKAKKDKSAEIKNRAEKRYEDIINGNIKILYWKKLKDAYDGDYIELDKNYDIYTDVLTNKLNIKESFVKDYHKYVNTFDRFKEFVSVYFRLLSHYLADCPEENVRWQEASFGVSSQGICLQINVEFLNIAIDVRRKKGSYTYRLSQLKMVDGKSCIQHGNDFVFYEDFHRKGMELIKTESKQSV